MIQRKTTNRLGSENGMIEIKDHPWFKGFPGVHSWKRTWPLHLCLRISLVAKTTGTKYQKPVRTRTSNRTCCCCGTRKWRSCLEATPTTAVSRRTRRWRNIQRPQQIRMDHTPRRKRACEAKSPRPTISSSYDIVYFFIIFTNHQVK